MNLDPELAQRLILNRAAVIANKSPDLPPELAGVGDLFRENNNLSGNNYLTMSFEPGALDYFLPEQHDQMIIKLNEIATNALHQSIVENGKLFAGLIVGFGKQGVNYFDRFHA